MNAIRVYARIESETLHLPELKPLIGRAVEIIVLDQVPSQVSPRDEFYGRIRLSRPETPEERVAERQDLESMRRDARFERFWEMLDRILAGIRDEEAAASNAPPPGAVA